MAIEEQYATLREFDQLRAEFTETKHAVDELRSGNAAIAVLSTQLSGLTQAVTEVKTGMNTRFAEHDRVHKEDSDARVSSRRWLIGIAISGITALIGLYGWIALFIK